MTTMTKSQIVNAACAVTCSPKALATLPESSVNVLNEIVRSMSADEARIRELWVAAAIDEFTLDDLKAIVNK